MEPDHAVLDCDAVNEGLLVVKEVGVGDPQLVGHPVIQSQVVGDLGVGEPLVPPCLLEVHGQGVVLQEQRVFTLQVHFKPTCIEAKCW